MCRQHTMKPKLRLQHFLPGVHLYMEEWEKAEAGSIETAWLTKL